MGMPLLKVKERKETNKKYLKKIRKEGFVPAVIYGHNKKTKEVQFNKQELDKTLNHYGVGSSVQLSMGDEIRLAIIKDVQRHITKLHVLHIDLQELDEKEKVRVKLPIYLINKSAVESSTSVIQQQMTELEIQTLPKYLPQSIEVDVSTMKYGEPLTVKDLWVFNNENIEVLSDKDEIVALLAASTKLEIKEEEDPDDLLRKLY
ncbi:50S ribosomal protein L25 [Crassaminicella indica]|uniref:Large ribosomal subunit protein bL25 n=1 Tax=Crassaminicella indica TaxID=2855394 RepID=A0ABX8RFF5_9CLOT|nr:50S ribosomal protein L25 [Crassaminicella indica]QXM07149.1 50S ribosomal protein L25 [Crassaminicella indica]